MILLIDIDGTIRDVWASYRALALYVAPDLVLPEKGPRTYEFLEEYEDHSRYQQLFDLWHKKYLFSSAEPYPMAVEAVKYLQSRPEFEVFLVTQPMYGSETAHSENADWVRWCFGRDWEVRLIQTWDRTLIQADALIDDKPEITGLMPPTWDHVIFDQPYNRHIDKTRIMDWSRINGN
jgi:5'-nucleotidase